MALIDSNTGELAGPILAPVRPDPDRIFELIKARDPGHGRVTRFARRLGRNPQSLWNLREPGKGVSLAFLVQIAAALRVDLDEITLAETAAEPEDPQPMAEVA